MINLHSFVHSSIHIRSSSLTDWNIWNHLMLENQIKLCTKEPGFLCIQFRLHNWTVKIHHSSKTIQWTNGWMNCCDAQQLFNIVYNQPSNRNTQHHHQQIKNDKNMERKKNISFLRFVLFHFILFKDKQQPRNEFFWFVFSWHFKWVMFIVRNTILL